MARVLWISDAGTNTGFSRVTHSIGERLVRDYGHEIHALAIGYDAKYPPATSLKLYRAEAGPSHHTLGFDRVAELITRIEPDVVVTLEDLPQLRSRLTENPWDREGLLATKQPVVSFLPVDGYALPPSWWNPLRIVRGIALSRFGRDQLGVDIPVIYHGVDQTIFHPIDEEHPLTLDSGAVIASKGEARAALGVPQDLFVIGRVDTNSGRKDWPAHIRTLEYFFGFDRRPDAMALLHTSTKGSGVDLEAMIRKGKHAESYVVTANVEWPLPDLVALINSWDVCLTTTRGEGFGFGPAEAMACGVPVIATKGSAVEEVVGPGGILVDPVAGAYWANPYGVDMLLADTAAMAKHLLHLSRNPDRRVELGQAGLVHVQKNFSWDEAARRTHQQLESAVRP